MIFKETSNLCSAILPFMYALYLCLRLFFLGKLSFLFQTGFTYLTLKQSLRCLECTTNEL